MNPADDLDRLLALATDGELTDADRLHLAARLRDDPDAQRAYREYMVLDALLRWAKPTAGATAEPRAPRRWARRAVAVAVAACLLAVGIGLLLAPPREAVAKSDVVDRLAVWNVSIADAPTADARRERFRERADAFAAELGRAKLPPDERTLADSLYENARALAAADDPVAVAERLDGMSEALLAWMWANSDADPRRAAVMERHYLLFAERSLANVRRVADAPGVPDAARQRRIDRVTERVARRAEARVEKEAERSRNKAGR